MIFQLNGINKMAIPAYLWLKDDGGADIKGGVDVRGREGSILVALRRTETEMIERNFIFFQ